MKRAASVLEFAPLEYSMYRFGVVGCAAVIRHRAQFHLHQYTYLPPLHPKKRSSSCARLAKRIALKKNCRPTIAVTGRDALEGVDTAKRNEAVSTIKQEFSNCGLVPEEDYFVLDAQSRPVRYETVATVCRLMHAALERAGDRQVVNQLNTSR